MPWTMTRDADELLAAAGNFLRSRPVEHNLILTTLDRLHRAGPAAFGAGPPWLGWYAERGEPLGAFALTPPYPLNLTRLAPGPVAALADALAGAAVDLPAVGAEVGVAEEFAGCWRTRTGAGSTVHRRMRLYRLERLLPPDPPPPGRARLAAPPDRDLLVAWYEAFGHDAGDEVPNPAAQVADRLGYGGLVLWEVDGQPVSMAGRTPAVSGMARVAPVYTPAGHRGRGYGSAATAEVTRHALDSGATDVLLFTDLANPVANAIYQRLGYRPVEDRIVLSFAGGGDRSS